ncbi:hypothetical protein ABPG74_011187 [Tetrahymena malaccensis]
MLFSSFKNLLGILNILLLVIFSNAEEIKNVINQFNRDTISLKHPPFCIIRHRTENREWVDLYLSYDRKNHLMYVQKNKDEPIVVMNFQEKENFVLCYESTLVKNQITIISLQKNYTLIGMEAVDPLGRIFKQNPAELPQAIITEYQFNITSMKMFNAGNPIRYSNNINITARYSTQIEMVYNKTLAIDFKQYGLGPIPNYDYPFSIEIRPDGQIYLPDLFFFQYSYNFNYFYTQQWNVQPGVGGLATLRPQLDETYSTIQCSTIIITDDIFKTIATPFSVLNQHAPIMKRDVGLYCILELRYEFQPVNEELLMIKHNSTFYIIKRKDFWNFHYKDLSNNYCYFRRNETNQDLYYYSLGEFQLSSKDWLGIIVLEINDQNQYLLTQAVFSEDESELRDYRFYSIDLEKKTPPVLLTKEGDFQPIKGYYFYEGFTYYKGVPVKFKQEELNRYSMLYLVNGTDVLKLQFNPRIFLNKKSLLSFTNLIIVGNTLALALALGTFFTYLDNKKKSRLTQENKRKFQISTFRELNKGDETEIKHYLDQITSITQFFYNERKQIFTKEIDHILQGNQICLPAHSTIHKMTKDNNLIYSILFLDSVQIDQAWKFIDSIKNRMVSSENYNENHYIFSKIKYLIQSKNFFYEKQISRIIFVIQQNQQRLESSMKFCKNDQKPLKVKQVSTRKGEKFEFIAYNDSLDSLASHEIQIELILIRKFTIALKILRSQNIRVPDDFLDILKIDIFTFDDQDVNINPLFMFYAFSQNTQIKSQVKKEVVNQDMLQDIYLLATYRFIQYINENFKNANGDKQIPLIKFKTFDDCLRYYDFHISLSELQQRFKKTGELGGGGYGQVYRVKDLKNNGDCQENEDLAVKSQNLIKEDEVYAATKEFNINKRLTFNRTENVIKLRYGILINNVTIESISGIKQYNLSYFIMELGEITLQKELETKKIPFKPQELHDLMYQLCKGLNQMHNDAKTIHMDISLDNIIKTKDQEYKLSDLGSGLVQRNEFSQVVSKHFQFKKQYLSPKFNIQFQNAQTKSNTLQEALEKIKKDFQLLKQNDCYALGFVFYMVVTSNWIKVNLLIESNQELELRRQNMIEDLDSYKYSNNQQQKHILQQYPDYLIESIKSLLDYNEIAGVFKVIEEKQIMIQQENMTYTNEM